MDQFWKSCLCHPDRYTWYFIWKTKGMSQCPSYHDVMQNIGAWLGTHGDIFRNILVSLSPQLKLCAYGSCISHHKVSGYTSSTGQSVQAVADISVVAVCPAHSRGWTAVIFLPGVWNMAAAHVLWTRHSWDVLISAQGHPEHAAALSAPSGLPGMSACQMLLLL